MRAGLLRQLVSIETRSTSQDADGQQLAIWSTFIAAARAGIETLSVRELIAAQAANLQATHKITLRYDPRLEDPVAAGALRVVFRGRIFDIKGAANVDEMNQEIWLLATEGLT